MADTLVTSGLPLSSGVEEGTFPPMYYDSPSVQMVIGCTYTADDSLTASVSAGAPYFTVNKIDICNWEVVRTTPGAPGGELPVKLGGAGLSNAVIPVQSQRILSAPVASSNGLTPLTIKAEQYARLWVSARVPRGALPAGPFKGKAALQGKTLSKTVELEGTYLGNLIGSVTVEPATVAPGQPVLVQVLNASGRPYSDSSVTVSIQCVEATARYYQFATPGDRTLTVRAVRGSLSETAKAIVKVAGNPLSYRCALTDPPLSQMPILEVRQTLGQPYQATFTLGTPRWMLKKLAAQLAAASPAAVTPTPRSMRPIAPAPTSSFADDVSKALATLSPTDLKQVPSKTTPSGNYKMTVSAAWGPIGITNTTLAATSYEWNFGDGQTATTQSPTVTHDYKSAIQAEKIAHSFDVTCTVVHDNLTVKRTLVLHSAYGMCRRLGLIVPPVTGDTYATFQRVAFSGSMVIRNLESGTITLKSMACIPISDDVSVALPSPQFKAMERPIAIAENSFAGLGVYIPLSQLQAEGGVGPSTTGFTVYYSGSLLLTDGSSMPVRFSHTFRIPLTYAGVVNKWLSFPVDVSKWDISGALSAVSGVSARSVLSTSGTQILDPATNTVSIPLASSAPSPSVLAAVGIAVQSGLTKIAMSAGAIGETGVPVHVAATAKVAETVTIRPMDVTIDPDNPPPVVEGQPCYPDDISDTDAATAAAQQLVCQLTDVTETVTIPSSFQNALQGDVILSPGGDGAGQTIAGLLRALPHPQYHSHSGIMTRNFFEITHCTAEEKRYSNQNNMVKLDGAVPFMLGPDVLQYGWPGSITQTIDDATSGQQSWKDPGGTKYQIGGFTPDALGIQFDGFQVVSPLVIKPLPENEINFRPRLRQVADTARSKGATADANGNVTYQKGGCYYSFYCYTDPQISKGFTDQAGPDAGWAQGMSPAVCSSFVWLCMKENKIPLVTSNQYESASDLTLASVADGAAVGTATLDGLFYYSASARQEAGQALYQILQNTVEDQEPGILQNIPGLNSEFAGAIADQILNDFAYGDPTMWNSSAWQNTGDANAVSPDNIEWWKAPCFGYLEPLQYLPQHTEQYTVSQWTKVITWGTVSGVVTLQGHPVAGAYVYVYDGNDATTDASGHYMLNKVPVGSYAIKASAVENNFEYSNGLSGQTVTLTASNPNLTYDISLAGLPQSYRRLDATYSISCDHGDLNPGHTHGVQTDGPNSQSAFVNPGQLTSGFTYTFDYNGGGYFHIDYVFSVALLLDYSIEVTIDATMYDDGNNYQVSNTLGPFNFRMDGAYSGWINLENSNGYHDGPAQFTFTAWNNQQTG